METPARISWSHGDPALGCGGDDAARQRGHSRRPARRARNRIPRAGYGAAHHAAARPRPGEHRRIRGLADREPARDAPPARFRHRDPVALVSRLAKAASKAEAKWLQARESGKFEDFAPHLEEVVHLVRDKAQLLGQSRNLSPYDALVDEFSPGLTSAEIDTMFKALGRRLPGLIREVLARQEQRPLLPIVGKFSTGRQRALAVEIMKAVGFPFDRGRLDESEHPFTEGVPGDVRVTTRFDTAEPFTGC